MGFQARSVLALLLVSSLLCSLTTANIIGSVYFIDSRTHQYLRSPSSNDVAQSHSMSLLEIGAAASVLLGFAPSSKLSSDGSSKLNEVLAPNPFDRPRAVFMLEVSGVGDLPSIVDPANQIFHNALSRKIVDDSGRSHVELPGEEVFMISMDDGLADVTDEEISSFASWLGGSYVKDAVEALNGELTIPLYSGSSMNLHMSKKADCEFVASLVALFRNSKRALEMHEDLSHGTKRPSELLVGHFDGIKALLKEYGTDNIVQQGTEILVSTLSKLLNSLQSGYKGQIVGVICIDETVSSKSEPLLNIMLASRQSARLLAEETPSVPANVTAIAEMILVRRTLAWITGIILLVSTIMGIHLLLNMSLTRDTLLYSNVKLD